MVTAQPGIGLDEAKGVLHRNRIEKLPIVDGSGVIRGLVTGKDIRDGENYPDASKDKKGRPLVGAAVGVKGDFMDRAESLLDAGADAIVVDIAHGHSSNAINAVRNIKRAFPECELIAGNVATAAGVQDLVRAGVDAVKVGVGSGSICITRVVTGSGVPQLTAVLDCARAARDAGVPVISDGGTRTSGDATKALAAGASSVMVGSILGGTDESPGSILTKNGKRFKVYRGMASLGASLGRRSQEGAQGDGDVDLNDYVAEGVEAMVPHKGSVVDMIKQLAGGIRSGLSYCGARTIGQIAGERRVHQDVARRLCREPAARRLGRLGAGAARLLSRPLLHGPVITAKTVVGMVVGAVIISIGLASFLLDIELQEVVIDEEFAAGEQASYRFSAEAGARQHLLVKAGPVRGRGEQPRRGHAGPADHVPRERDL